MPMIYVRGLASGQTLGPFIAHQEDLKLMDFLLKQGIPVASSCMGQGLCKKCVIQNSWLSCQITIQEFLSLEPRGEVQLSYL